MALKKYGELLISEINNIYYAIVNIWDFYKLPGYTTLSGATLVFFYNPKVDLWQKETYYKLQYQPNKKYLFTLYKLQHENLVFGKWDGHVKRKFIC